MDKIWRYFQNLNGIEKRLKSNYLSEGKKAKLIFLRKRIMAKIEDLLQREAEGILKEKID
jgi:predicted DNA-binding antitoxin AbrB/MazE fold protein